MSQLSLQEPLVSSHWLARHLDHPQLLIFDGSLAEPGAKPITALTAQIGQAQFFDLNLISDQQSKYPHMMPSAEEFEKKVQALGVKNSHTIVVYDNKGIYSSARVWWMFKAMGCENVAVLDGGLPAWLRAGYNVNYRDFVLPKLDRGDFKATVLPNYFCDMQQVAQALTDPFINILDARSSARFLGEEADPRAGVRAGHMPGAINIHYASLLERHGVNGGLMKSKRALTQLFRDCNLEHNQLILSCGSGVTACVLALAASIIGYTKVMVYDGSWAQWGSEPQCSVVY